MKRLEIQLTRYLWCVNHHGPNNQLKGFIKCSVIAILLNLTLVIPPLYPHYQDRVQGIQWLDHFYDVEQLSRVLNLIKIDQFIVQTDNNDNKTVIDCYMLQLQMVPFITLHGNNTLRSIEQYFQRKILFNHHINFGGYPSLEQVIKAAENCTSIFLNIDYLALVHLSSAQNIHTQRLFRHLHRTAAIRRMASRMIDLLPGLVDGNHTGNRLTSFAVAHMRLGDRVVLNVAMYVQQILQLIRSGTHFTHLHIMCPFLTPADIKFLKIKIPVAITYTQILLQHIHFSMDEYLFDILEQEIAFQASVFIASPITTYSSTVVLQKLNQKKGLVYTFSKKGYNRTFPITKENATYYFR